MLARRNKQILALSILGMFLFAGLGWLVYGLAAEAIAASIEMTEAVEEGGHQLNGGIWYSLYATQSLLKHQTSHLHFLIFSKLD